MAARFASKTKVNQADTRAEIEHTLTRYGADSFAYGWSPEGGQVAFRMRGRHIRLRVPMPEKESFRYTPARHMWRDDAATAAEWEQGCRQRWRALALVVKAKLEAVEAGIVSFDDEFLAHTMLPNGETAGEWLGPQMEEAYRSGQMPAALPGLALPALPDSKGKG